MRLKIAAALVVLVVAAAVIAQPISQGFKLPVWNGIGYSFPALGPTFTIAGGQINAVAPTQAAGPKFSDQETPAGNIDGSNLTFTLAQAPNPPGSLILCRNGLAQRTGGDYSISGTTITFLSTSAPQPGDSLLAWYRY